MTVSGPSALASAIGGMQQAEQGLDNDAVRIAQDPGDIAAMVDVGVEPIAYAANAMVIHAAEQNQRSLLDMLA